MRLSPLQQRILADMGIQNWALRGSDLPISNKSSAPSMSSVSAASISIDVQILLVLVVEDIHFSDAAQRLLNAMLKAISLNPDRIKMLSVDDFQQVDQASLADKTVLLMGTRLTQQFMPELLPDKPELIQQQQAFFTACFSLDEMLQHPLRKAPAWQALRYIRSVLRGHD